MRREDAAFVSTRASHTYYVDDVEPGLRQRVRAACTDSSYYTAMLREDMRVVIPFRVGDENAFAITVDGPTSDRPAQLIANALGSDSGRPSLEGAVRGFFNKLAPLLVVCGPVTYEIAYHRPTADPDSDPVGFRLELILPGSLGRRFGQPIQYVPRALGQHVIRRGLGYVTLEPQNLVTFRLDKRTERAVRRAVDFLDVAGALQDRELELTKQSLTGSTRYDPMAHRRATGELIAKATSPIGWNVRDLYTDDRLQPYLIWRRLRFLEFQAVVRESLLVQTNRVLERVGARLGFDGRIVISGLPSPSDVRLARQDLEAGTRGLDDLVQYSVSGVAPAAPPP